MDQTMAQQKICRFIGKVYSIILYIQTMAITFQPPTNTHTYNKITKIVPFYLPTSDNQFNLCMPTCCWIFITTFKFRSARKVLDDILYCLYMEKVCVPFQNRSSMFCICVKLWWRSKIRRKKWTKNIQKFECGRKGFFSHRFLAVFFFYLSPRWLCLCNNRKFISNFPRLPYHMQARVNTTQLKGAQAQILNVQLKVR